MTNLLRAGRLQQKQDALSIACRRDEN